VLVRTARPGRIRPASIWGKEIKMTGDTQDRDVQTVLDIIKDSLAHLITKPGIILISVFLLLIVFCFGAIEK
jgi:hypothetical protein